MRTFHRAGGCFWCLDTVYRVLDGVSDVMSGYTGGHVENFSYELVCTGSTGHAAQYRSAMFFVDDEQKALFRAARDRASEFWEGNPGQSYGLAVALPKVTKIRASYAPDVTTS